MMDKLNATRNRPKSAAGIARCRSATTARRDVSPSSPPRADSRSPPRARPLSGMFPPRSSSPELTGNGNGGGNAGTGAGMGTGTARQRLRSAPPSSSSSSGRNAGARAVSTSTPQLLLFTGPNMSADAADTRARSSMDSMPALGMSLMGSSRIPYSKSYDAPTMLPVCSPPPPTTHHPPRHDAENHDRDHDHDHGLQQQQQYHHAHPVVKSSIETSVRVVSFEHHHHH